MSCGLCTGEWLHFVPTSTGVGVLLGAAFGSNPVVCGCDFDLQRAPSPTFCCVRSSNMMTAASVCAVLRDLLFVTTVVLQVCI